MNKDVLIKEQDSDICPECKSENYDIGYCEDCGYDRWIEEYDG